jgi:serine protease Do
MNLTGTRAWPIVTTILALACNGGPGDGDARQPHKVVIPAESPRKHPVPVPVEARADVRGQSDTPPGVPGESDGSSRGGEAEDGRFLPDFVATYKTALPAVVKVSAYGSVEDILAQQPVPIAEGAGFFYNKPGQVVTNSHLVGGAMAFEVETPDGVVYLAELVGADPFTDVALLAVRGESLPRPLLPAPPGLLREGAWVMAIGNPLGLEFSATHGIISALNRTDVVWDDVGYWDFIQTDAALNQGNSGGPLLDVQGRVVGICTTSEEKGERIGYAIPMSTATVVLEHLEKYGQLRRGWLGIQTIEEEGQVVVVGLYPDSPALLAGFELEDVVLELDGKPVERVDKLRWLIAIHDLETAALFKVARGEEEFFVEVYLEPAASFVR